MSNKPDEQRIRFEACLNSERPFLALHDLAKALRDEGVTQLDLYLLFDSSREGLPDDFRYDAILDVMDFIVGGPIAKGNDLYTSTIDYEDVKASRSQSR